MKDTFIAVEAAFNDLCVVQEEIKNLNAQLRDSATHDDRQKIIDQVNRMQDKLKQAHNEYNGAINAHIEQLKIQRK